MRADVPLLVDSPLRTRPLVPTSFEEFCEALIGWRIVVDDEDQAIGLYHSQGYPALVPYLDYLRFRTGSANGAFKTVTELGALVALDLELRSLILAGVTTIELQIKAQYARAMHEAYGANGIENLANYRHERRPSQIIKSITGARRNRNWPATDCNPRSADSRTAADLATLGELAALLEDTRSGWVRQRVADSFAANSRCLASWLRCLVSARNTCAHACAFCVGASTPSNPKPVNGFQDDPTRPLYALILIERLLDGRVQAGIPGAEDELFRFAWNASALLSEFAQAHPGLARSLAIPKPYLELVGKLPLVHAPASTSAPVTSYQAIALIA